jgi:rhodanese-related sulfurtransferase
MAVKSPPGKRPVSQRATAKDLRKIPRVSIKELSYKVENKTDILVVDTREEDQYKLDHIKGAISTPLSKILEGKWIPPSNKDIILYCS